MRKLKYTIEINDPQAVEALKVIEEDGLHGKSVVEDFVNSCIANFIDDVILSNEEEHICDQCRSQQTQNNDPEPNTKKWN